MGMSLLAAVLCPLLSVPALAASGSVLPAWAELLKRVFSVDVLRCGCGGRRKILAAITQAEAIVAILAALHLPTEAPVAHTRMDWARGPPGLFGEE